MHTVVFIYFLKNVSREYDRWVVETQLCKCIKACDRFNVFFLFRDDETAKTSTLTVTHDTRDCTAVRVVYCTSSITFFVSQVYAYDPCSFGTLCLLSAVRLQAFIDHPRCQCRALSATTAVDDYSWLEGEEYNVPYTGASLLIRCEMQVAKQHTKREASRHDSITTRYCGIYANVRGRRLTEITSAIFLWF